MMNDDPIVDEARRAGEAYLAQFDFDMKTACEDLRRRTEEARKAGRQILSLPPKRVSALPRVRK
jgi:hypothetical protein